MTGNRRIDPTERAHLRDASGYAPRSTATPSTPSLAGLVRRYWMPVWSLPAGQRSEQRVLQYPVCLLVVSHEYDLLVGPSTGLSTQVLEGSGWALGTMLQPAAGALVWGASVDGLTDRTVPLTEAPGLDGAALVRRIRAAVGDDPEDREGQQAGVARSRRPRPGCAGRRGGRAGQRDRGVRRGRPRACSVGQVCEKFAIGERSLQRLTARRIGLTPKWLIQRRRLHEAAERLTDPDRPDLARVAADLGYADQAHFGRDFRTVTGLTPGEYAAEPRP